MPLNDETFQLENMATTDETITIMRSGIPPPKQHSGLAKRATRQIRTIIFRRVAEAKSNNESREKMTIDMPSQATSAPAEKDISPKQKNQPAPPLRQLSEVEVLEPNVVVTDDEPHFQGAGTNVSPDAVRRVSAINIGDASQAAPFSPPRQFSEIEVMEPLTDDDDDDDDEQHVEQETTPEIHSKAPSINQLPKLRQQLSEIASLEPAIVYGELETADSMLESMRRGKIDEPPPAIVLPQLREPSEVEIQEPPAMDDADELFHGAVGAAPGSTRRVSEVEIASGSIRRGSEVEIEGPRADSIVDEQDLLLLTVESEREAVRRRMSAVKIEEAQVRLAPAVSAGDYLVDTSDYNMVEKMSITPDQQHRQGITLSPARKGMLLMPGVQQLSLVRIEEPLEPATASTAHDLTEGGTERSEDDYLLSPTSVTTKKISSALMRGVSLVKVQEPNLSVATIDELVATLPDIAGSMKLEPETDAIISTVMTDSKSGKASVRAATTIPGAMAVLPQKPRPTNSNEDDDYFEDHIAIKTRERHRVSVAVSGAVSVSPPRQRKQLQEEMMRLEDGVLQDDIAIKSGGRYRWAAAPGAVPVSPPRESENLKEEMQRHDDGILQDAIAMKTGGLRRQRRTSTSFDGVRLPGMFPTRALKEDVERHDVGILQNTTAMTASLNHRRNRRTRSNASANSTRPGAIPIPKRNGNESLTEAMQRHDDGVLQDDIAIKTGRQHRRRGKLGGFGRRRTSIDHVSARTEDDDPAQSNHTSESTRPYRRRRTRQTSKATGTGNEGAINAKTEEYGNLVRQKEGYVELGEGEWSDEDELYDDDQLVYPGAEFVPSEQDRANGTDIEAFESGVPSVGGDDLSAYVQPYSEWEAEKAAKMRKKQQCRAIAAFMSLLIIVGAVIGVVVAVTSPGTPSREPTPVQMPTSAPTIDIMPCVDAAVPFYSPRYNELRALLLNNSRGTPTQVDEPGSPQRRALCWIAVGDQLQLVAEGFNLPAIVQRYTLAVLYYALTMLNQTIGLTTTNFLTPVNECQWEGINCNVTDKVTGLSLENEYLQGTFPAEIANLNNAGVLVVNNNAIMALPADIWKIARLGTIDFGANQLALPIPSDVGYLTNLRELLFDGNNINGTLPPELFSLTSLEKISLQSNSITGSLPSSVGEISKAALKYLILATNRLDGTLPSKIGSLTRLEILSLASNSLSGTIPSEIGLLTNLATLDLSINNLMGTIPSVFGNLTRVKTIVLTSNRLTGSVPSEICRLRQLGSLQTLNVDRKRVACTCCD